MRSLSGTAYCFVLGLAAISMTHGQEAQQPVFRAETGLVQVHASITDQSGNPLNNIPQSAVRVVENGAPQQVRFVGQENVPVSVALAIDGGAGPEPVQAVSAALMAALESGDLAYVARFDAEPGAAPTALTRDRGNVQQVSLRPRTPMRDALLLLINRMEDNGNEVKRALVVLAYSATYKSWHSRQEVIDAARQKGVSIYAVDLKPPADAPTTGVMNRTAGALRRAFNWTVDLFDNDIRTPEQVESELEKLTDATGGGMCAAESAEESARCAREFAREIRSQYVIAYRPTELRRADRKIEITVADHPEAVVRVRKASPTAVKDKQKP